MAERSYRGQAASRSRENGQTKRSVRRVSEGDTAARLDPGGIKNEVVARKIVRQRVVQAATLKELLDQHAKAVPPSGLIAQLQTLMDGASPDGTGAAEDHGNAVLERRVLFGGQHGGRCCGIRAIGVQQHGDS